MYLAHRIVLLQPIAGTFLYRVTGEGSNVQINISVMFRKVREVLSDLLATYCLRKYSSQRSLKALPARKLIQRLKYVSVFFQMNYV